MLLVDAPLPKKTIFFLYDPIRDLDDDLHLTCYIMFTKDTLESDHIVCSTGEAVFSMGGGTLAVPMELFALNRRRLCERLRLVAPRGVVLLQGGRDFDLHDTDVTFVFQQVGGSAVAPQVAQRVS